MDVYLSTLELVVMATKMNFVVDDIFEAENQHHAFETVDASLPLGFLGILGLKKHPTIIEVKGLRFAAGEKDMEALVFQEDGQNMVAVKVLRIGRSQVEYNLYSVADYANWLTRDGHRLLALKARQEIARAQWHLEQLLPEGHTLRKQHYVERYQE